MSEPSKTFWEISDIPPALQERYYGIISDRIFNMKKSLLESVEALIGLYKRTDGNFVFEQEIYYGFDKLGEFVDIVDIELPFDLKVRMNEIIGDYIIVAMSLANAMRQVERPQQPTEGEQQ